MADALTPPPADDDQPQVVIETTGGAAGEPTIDPATGATIIHSDDGSVEIDLSPPLPAPDLSDTKFDANLAELLTAEERDRIVSELLEAIAADEQSRAEWLETRAKGLSLLGLKLEEPRGDTGASTSPIEGQSVVVHPLLTESVIRFQSNASAELLPTEGPVKVRNDSTPPPTQQAQDAYAAMGHNGGPPMEDDDPVADALKIVKQLDDADGDEPPETPPPRPNSYDMDELAKALELDLNHYLTVTDKGYRPDTDRMLFSVGFGGCSFKKVYADPIRRMPISRSVDPRDLIVSNEANDLEDAGRVTHRILMRKSTLIRMQIAGAYRKIDSLGQPQYQSNAVTDKVASIQGFNAQPQRPEDQPYTIYECYVELNLKGFEHKDSAGDETGLQLPYKISIEKDNRHLLEVRRNWKKDDPQCLARRSFVKFPFVPALGFYDIGLLHILGNASRALTAAWRLMLDAGMFACFPGFLYADVAGRQTTNEFRVPPGGGVKVQTGGKNIDQVVSRLPYNDVTPGLAELTKMIEATAQRAGGTAEIQVGEGRQDAPVGTTLALLDQATKMLAAVHIRLHAAQSEEFQLLKERFREDPTALWRNNRRPARQWEVAEFLAALDECDLTPAADPNTPSKMHRIMQAVAVKQLQAVAPQLYDAVAVDTAILKMIGISNPYALFNKNPQANAPPPEPPDPTKIAEANIKAQAMQNEAAAKSAQIAQQSQEAAQQHQAQMQELALESQDRAADRASRETVTQMRIQGEQMKLSHAAGEAAADRAHEAGLAQGAQQHEAGMAAGGQVHEAQQTAMQNYHEQAVSDADKQHELAKTEMGQEHESEAAEAQRKHEAAQAAKKPAAARADGGAVTTPTWPRVI